jgi:quinol monooxygenase YgiN
MALSEIIDQLESGDDVTAITHTLQLEVEEEARRKFADQLQIVRKETTARLKKEAEAEAEDEARILQEEWRSEFLDEHRARAHSKAWTEELKHWTDLFAGRDNVKEEAKRAAKRTGDREYYDTLEDCHANNKAIADKELSTEIAAYKDQRRAVLMLRADQEVAREERELVRQAAVRLGLIDPLGQEPSPPVPKRARNEPRSHTAALALKDARSRSASLSTVRKRGRSASLDTPRQSTFQAHTEPSPCPSAGDDDTPMNSPSESLTGSQIAQVKQELVEDDPLRGLRSSSHCPDNAMTDDSPSPPKPDWPSAAHSRHATPAPDFARLPSHFTPAPDMSPNANPFTARIGGNDEDDGPAPSDRTPTGEPDPAMATAHHITNAVRHEVEQRLNPIVLQLNSLTGLMQRLSDKVFSAPAVATKAAPPSAAPTLARTQNVSHPTIPVSKDTPVPRVPATNSRGMPDTVTVPSHIPVTDAMLEDPRPVPSLEPVDAAMFPSLEETRLAIPSCRVKRNAENKAAREEQRRSVPGATGPTPTPLPAPHVARIDDDNGHIPLRTSRVRPMFASVATQKAMKDHQTATTTGNQARAVQGRSKSGQAKSVPSTEESVTHATIIRHGGLPDAEAERALCAKPTHFLVQAAQRALDRLLRQSPRILHGSWSLNYDQTRNFSLVLSGHIPARELLKYKTQLCEPFLGAETDLVPARGWSWAQLRNVPTVDEDGLVWSPKDLFHTFITNPCFAEALICAPPHWQGNPIFSGKEASTVFVAYIDEGNLISQRASKEGVYMFGRQVAFIHCGDSPTLVQCSRCHMLGHYATSTRCQAPVNSIKCYCCGAAHNGRQHDYECTKNHKVPGKCDCVLKCLLCGDKNHHCRSQKCPKRGPGPSGIAKLPAHPETDESQTGDRKATADDTRQKRQSKGSTGKGKSKVPYTNHDAVMTVPAGACANDPEKNNILCECCPPPSIVNFINRYLGAPEATDNAPTRSYPRARPVSSKGKGLVDIHSEITARKKYGTATLREKSAELDIALHDDKEIEQLLAEGETATMYSKLTPEELNYGCPLPQQWGLEEAGPSTGWETTEDTATVIAIHPEAHLVCDTAEIADIRRKTFQRSDDQGWTQRGHPNMIVRAAKDTPKTPNPANPFNVLADRND